MNRRILILVDKYYPRPSPNTSCVEKIAKQLVANGDEVIYLVKKFIGEEKFVSDNVFYLYVNKHHFFDLLKIDNELKMNVFARKSLSLMGRCYAKIASEEIEDYGRFDYSFHGIKKVIGSIYAKKPIDVMISVSAPIEMQIIASVIKDCYPSISWYAYMLDPYTLNATSPIDKQKQRLALENRLFGKVKKIFMQPCTLEENKRRNIQFDYYDKVVTLDLPNLIKPPVSVQTAKQANDDNKLKVVYTGGFYADIRNPRVMLEVLSRLSLDYVFDILSQGCENIVREAQSKFGEKLVVHAFLPKAEADAYVESANVLINLSNTITNQMPSKVFECISTGKPIVNFYLVDNDTSLKYLTKYPLAYNFDLREYGDEDVLALEQFIKENGRKVISFEEATINLQDILSENVVNKMIATIDATEGESK